MFITILSSISWFKFFKFFNPFIVCLNELGVCDIKSEIRKIEKVSILFLYMVVNFSEANTLPFVCKTTFMPIFLILSIILSKSFLRVGSPPVRMILLTPFLESCISFFSIDSKIKYLLFFFKKSQNLQLLLHLYPILSFFSMFLFSINFKKELI